MTTPASPPPRGQRRASDLRGVVQLATQATTGVIGIVEGVHQSVWSTLGVAGGDTPGRTAGLTGLIYRNIHGVVRLLGNGADAVLRSLQPLSGDADAAKPESPQREALLAALNGVLGDRLAASANPLATSMRLRHGGESVDWASQTPIPEASGKVLLLVHGLCMNDRQWRTQRDGRTVDHGEALAAKRGYTPVYVRYNSGLHISQNGRALSSLIEQLIARWPVPVEDLSVVAHSMGGLVIRSACHVGAQDALRWPKHLRHIVFLGTPHHGAPLERAGNWVDVVLGSTPYTAPFAKLGQLRSAGITDLRHGHVVDEDWQGHDRFQRGSDRRRKTALPEGVACHAIAATTAAKGSRAAWRLIGDGLVPVRSALGQHADAQRNLAFAKTSRRIMYRTDHLGLLSNPAVTRCLLSWLKPTSR